MPRMLTDLMAADVLAQRFGCALNPKLKAAIKADLQMFGHVAGPVPRVQDLPATLPENVVSLRHRSRSSGQKKA